MNPENYPTYEDLLEELEFTRQFIVDHGLLWELGNAWSHHQRYLREQVALKNQSR